MSRKKTDNKEVTAQQTVDSEAKKWRIGRKSEKKGDRWWARGKKRLEMRNIGGGHGNQTDPKATGWKTP